MKTLFPKTDSLHSTRRPLGGWTITLLATCLALATAAAQSSTRSADPSSSSTRADRADSSSGTSGGSDPTVRGKELTDPRRSPDPTRAANREKSLERPDRKFITKTAESTQKEMALAQLAAQRATRPDVRHFSQELVADHQQMSGRLSQLAEQKGVQLESMDPKRMASASSAGMSESTNAGMARGQGAPRATGAAGTANTGASTGVVPNESTATSGSSSGRGDVMNTAALPAEIASDRDYRNLARTTGEEFDREYVDLMVDQHERDVQLFQKTAKGAKDPDVREFAKAHLGKLQAHLDRAKNLMQSAAE